MDRELAWSVRDGAACEDEPSVWRRVALQAAAVYRPDEAAPVPKHFFSAAGNYTSMLSKQAKLGPRPRTVYRAMLAEN